MLTTTQTLDAPALLDAFGAGYLVQDADGAVVSANALAQLVLAYGRDSVAGRTPTDSRWGCVDASGAPLPGGRFPGILTLRTGREVHGFVFGLRSGTAQTRWLRADSVVLERDSEGRPGLVACLLVDVSDMFPGPTVTAGPELDRTAELAADGSQDVMMRIDAAGRLVEVSRGSREVFGVAASHLVGRRLASLVHAGSLDQLEQALAGARTTGSARGRVRCRRQDGELHWVDLAVRQATDASSGLPVLELVVRDVHAEHSATEAGAGAAGAGAEAGDSGASEAASPAAPSSGRIEDLVTVHDGDGRYLHVSPSVWNLLGYAPSELVGCRMEELAHPEDVHALLAALAQLREGRPATVGYRARRADGTWLTLRAGAQPVLDSRGRVLEIRAVTRLA